MEIFNPVSLSIPENEFVLRHAGEPWVVASRDIHPVFLPQPHKKDKNPVHYPDGVTPAAVKPVIDRIYELEELHKHEGLKWVGIELVTKAIRAYIEQSRLWEANKKRGSVRFPSMHTFSSKGKAMLGAPGSDSGFVKTYFDKEGNRVPFALKLVPDDFETWAPEWLSKVAETDNPTPTDGIKVDEENSRIECLVCGKTESYRPESRSSHNAARARMSKHLRSATDKPEAHREAHSKVFAS